MTYDEIIALENSLNINLDSASPNEFKELLETVYVNNSYIDMYRSVSYNKVVKDICEIRRLLDDNRRDYHSAKWEQYDARHYTSMINAGRSCMAYLDWKTVNHKKNKRFLFYDLVLALGYDGLKSFPDLINTKPEDYNPEQHTLKCGERLLHLSSFTQELLEINISASQIRDRRIIYFMPYRGSLIRFPTYFNDQSENDSREERKVANSISIGIKRLYGTSVKLWEMNLMKVYDVMQDEMDADQINEILNSGKLIKEWIKSHDVFAFTDEEIETPIFIMKLKTTNPYAAKG